jgi:hypothetical protein
VTLLEGDGEGGKEDAEQFKHPERVADRMGWSFALLQLVGLAGPRPASPGGSQRLDFLTRRDNFAPRSPRDSRGQPESARWR